MRHSILNKLNKILATGNRPPEHMDTICRFRNPRAAANVSACRLSTWFPCISMSLARRDHDGPARQPVEPAETEWEQEQVIAADAQELREQRAEREKMKRAAG